MFLPPIIADAGTHLQFIFMFEMDQPEDPEDKLEEFLQQAYDTYCRKYTLQPAICASIRRVDIKRLCGIILGEYERHPQFGTQARLYVSACVEKETKESKANPIPFFQEYLTYNLHWYGESDKILPIFPLGFQLVNGCHRLPDGCRSITTIDLRVINKEIDASIDFLVDEAIPELNSYLEYIKEVYTHTTQAEYTIDHADIQAHLTELIQKYYECRLSNPTYDVRMFLCLDVIFCGKSAEDFRVSFYIRSRSETTSTTELPATHEDYKSLGLSQDQYLYAAHSGNGATKIKEHKTV